MFKAGLYTARFLDLSETFIYEPLRLFKETEAMVYIDVVGLDIAFRSTSNLQVINIPPGTRADILTQSLDIRLRGPADELAVITPMNLRVVADLTDMSTGTARVIARVYISGIEANVDPVGVYEMTVTIVSD